MNDCWLAPECKRLHCDDKNGCLILCKLNYLYEQAGVSVKQRRSIQLRVDDDGTDLEEFKRLRDIQNDMVSFVGSGNNLYLHSTTVGCGKTSWSLRLLQCYFKKIWLTSPLTCRALFINVPSFLIALKDNITNRNEYISHIKEYVLTCDLVIWDDIGNKLGTEFEVSNLLSMIDARINSGKSNIFTSNLNEKEMLMSLGDRLTSRICNSSINIEFHGGDKRYLGLED